MTIIIIAVIFFCGILVGERFRPGEKIWAWIDNWLATHGERVTEDDYQ